MERLTAQRTETLRQPGRYTRGGQPRPRRVQLLNTLSRRVGAARTPLTPTGVGSALGYALAGGLLPRIVSSVVIVSVTMRRPSARLSSWSCRTLAVSLFATLRTDVIRGSAWTLILNDSIPSWARMSESRNSTSFWRASATEPLSVESSVAPISVACAAASAPCCKVCRNRGISACIRATNCIMSAAAFSKRLLAWRRLSWPSARAVASCIELTRFAGARHTPTGSVGLHPTAS